MEDHSSYILKMQPYGTFPSRLIMQQLNNYFDNDLTFKSLLKGGTI